MKWREIIGDYFTFTRRERIGIITTILLIMILAFSPSFFAANQATKLEIPDTTWVTAIKKLEQKETHSESNNYDDGESYTHQYEPSKTSNGNKPAGELFYFDPNTLSKEHWQKLGVRDKTIQTIVNYLARGGHFGKPEDLQRVYGLRKNEYERLAPFIKIQSGSRIKNAESFTSNYVSSQNTTPVRPAYRSLSIDINSADTAAFIALPGIGSKLAGRIVNFREKLGGFYSIEQVRETFGLPDSTFQKIKENLLLTTITLRKININTATTDELKSHPYITWNIANTIIAYRNEHGAFSSTGDLKKIMVITDDMYKKMAPYLVSQ